MPGEPAFPLEIQAFRSPNALLFKGFRVVAGNQRMLVIAVTELLPG